MPKKNYIDKRIALLNLFGYPLLLHHASAEDYFEVRILSLLFFERTDISEESVFGVLSDEGAAVEQRYIRIFRLFGETEAHFFKQTLESLTVGNVALAAESVDISERPTPVKRKGRVSSTAHKRVQVRRTPSVCQAPPAEQLYFCLWKVAHRLKETR